MGTALLEGALWHRTKCAQSDWGSHCRIVRRANFPNNKIGRMATGAYIVIGHTASRPRLAGCRCRLGECAKLIFIPRTLIA
jgi:hypothetical protein